MLKFMSDYPMLDYYYYYYSYDCYEYHATLNDC